ncbi:MAG: S8/S53 family peptidase [Bacteroidota bacterium]
MLRLISVVGLMLCACIAGLAGVIDPILKAKLEQASEMELIRVVARLNDRADLTGLDIELKARRATREERHYEMVTTLQQKAAATQGDLLAYLAEKKNSGLVREFESFWIDNMVGFSAPAGIVREVAKRGDVEVVFIEPEIIYDEPMDVGFSTESVASSEPGLRAINAHKLWRLGITGKGRLVMNIDTGVNGNHPALSARWRGTVPGVLASHAWYNGGGSSFPADTDNPGHGTHTMGTMTGFNPSNNDTIGVAPDAYWIAGTGSYTGAFQWAADPDNNPFTLTDVPDVINCSWFTNGDPCGGGSQYWALMDNAELVGAVVIWSAGNCGPSGGAGSCVTGVSPGAYKTVTPPKNRADSEVNAFAVGALDGNNSAHGIAGFSSRGPSACDTTIIKPEVSAPGVSVRSTYANGGYGTLSGTSMASPHVAGAVALLRQINPNAPSDAVKLALLLTARDLGTPGEDNAYGMGIVDVFAAAEMISPYHIVGTVSSSATEAPIRNARIEILETSQERFSDSTGGYAVNPLFDTVQVRVSAFTYYDTTVTMILQPDVNTTFNVTLNSLPLASVAGAISDSATSQGVAARVDLFAQGDPNSDPTYSTNSAASGSFGLSAIAGTYRVEIIPPAPYPDKITVNNVVVSPSGATLNVQLAQAFLLIVDDDGGALYDTLYRNSANRLGIRRRTFGNTDSASALGAVLSTFTSKPVLLWFTGNDSTEAITANERTTILNHFNAGGRAIISGQNIAQFASGGDPLIAGALGIQYTGTSVAAFLRGFDGDVIGAGVNYIMTGGANNQNSKDIISIIGGSSGTPTRTLYYAPDTTALAGVRVLGTSSGWGAAFFSFGLEGLAPARVDTFITRSLRYFSQIVVGVDEGENPTIPTEFVLEQNYPNPFNPSTVIKYQLGSSNAVLLRVFDILGREVLTLVNGRQEAGRHSVEFNAQNLGSGVYFYRLEAGTFVAQKKMILMK